MIKIIEKSIDELVPYENNARINDKAVEIVANSISSFGFRNPCIIDKNNVIVAGHTRVLACKKLGIDKVPCIVADDLTEEQIKAFRIADNSSAQIAEWDMDKLMKELETIDYDMEQFGLAEQLAEIEKTIEQEKQAEEDDYVEPDDLEIRVHKGEVWQLGRHRLMCGDSTKEEDVAKLMNGQKADLVFTDPPYNVDYSNAERPKASKTNLGKIKNDTMSEDAFTCFLAEVYKRLDENTKNNSSFYIWYADKSTVPFYINLNKTNIKFNQMLIWKKPMLLGRGKYQWAHEPCIFAVKGSPYFTKDRTKTTVWDFGGYDKSKNIHPTQKPLFLPTEAINNSSIKGNIILDLFGGSGSTLIACEQLDRICYMMELDEHYATVIVDRWEKLTGQKAEKIN